MFLFLLAGVAVADDLSVLSDEFDQANTLQNWQDIVEVEGWVTPSHESADIDITRPGRFHIVPGANTWFFKEKNKISRTKPVI